MLSFVIFCVFNFPKINGKFNLFVKEREQTSTISSSTAKENIN